MANVNWIQRLKALLDAIKAVTDVLPDGGALTTLQAAADAIQAVTDNLPDAGALTTIQADLDNPDQYKANVAALALEATVADLITRVKGLNDIHDDAVTNEALQATSRALLVTVAAYLDTEIDAILTIVNNLPDAGALNDLATILGRVTAAVATAAALVTHDTDIKALLATVQADLDDTAQYKATGFATAVALTAAKAVIDAIKTIVDTPANFMADVTALALEATLTAIKGVGFATGTDSLKILSDVLDAITAAGPTLVQMQAARDAVIAAIPAMRGTDGAATVAAGWDAALATILDNFTAGRITNLDELGAGNIPADIDGLKTSRDRQLFTMDFWSLPQEEVAVVQAAGDKGLPSVSVADLPGGATIVRAIAMFKFRMVENHTYAGENKLDGAQEIQVAGSVNAINFVDTQFTIAETTREGGDVVMGLIDIATTVSANGAYAFHWDLAKALQTGIKFNDVQMGIRIWYSV